MSSLSQDFKLSSLLKFALPSMTMMVFMSIYTIADGIFVSRYLGDNALSALNIVYPAMSFLNALGIMTATGGSAIIGKKLGEGHAEKAREDFTAFIVSGVTISLILAAITMIFMEPLLSSLGADASLYENSSSYLRTITAFAPASMLQVLFLTYFITDGNPHLGMVLTVISGITNIVLDYIFLGVLRIGIYGAAIATGLGQSICAAVGLIYFTFSRKSLYFVRFKLHIPTLLKAFSNGASEMVNNLSGGIITLIFNIIMMNLVGEAGVASITIVLYAQFLFNSLFMGFSMGIAPIISYNYGANNRKQLKKVYRISAVFIAFSSIIITLLSCLSGDLITSIFVPMESPTYALASSGFILFSTGYLLSGLNIFSSSLFTALSNGRISALISFARSLFFAAAFLIILPKLIGIDGVWLAVPAAELMTFLLSLYFNISERKKYHYI